MANLIEFLKSNSVTALPLPSEFLEKLHIRGILSLMDLFSSLQMQKVGRSPSLKDWSNTDIATLNTTLMNFLNENGVGRAKDGAGQSIARTQVQAKLPDNKSVASPPVEKPYLRILGGDLLTQEAVLQVKLRNVELVGEIPITKDELSILANHFRRIFSKYSAIAALDAIENGAPASFILFLVAQGVYGYNGGDYWTSVSDALDHHVDYRVGQVFERIIRRRRLALFDELQKKSTRYVSLILAHGGIPVYSLDDYFSNLVLASIARPQYAGLDGNELLDALLSSSVVTFTDKPVIHFLEYGGRVALDIFNRSRRLLLQYQASQIVPSAEEIGLPHHMVDHFAEWSQKQGATASSTRSSKGRLKKPEFCLDPWGIGIFLKLPAQTIPVFDAADCAWEILAGDQDYHIPVNVNSQGFTREITLRVDVVADIYRIKFCQGDKEFEWKFDVPNLVFIFDPIHGTLQNRLTNSELWLLYPRHLEAQVTEGDGYQTEELPAMPGNWYKLRAEGWDLSAAGKLAFVQHGVLFKEFDVKTQEVIIPPSLIGGKPLENNLGDSKDGGLVFVGKPPSIQIPIADGIDVGEALTRWRISIKAVGFADPNALYQAQLSELPESAISRGLGNIQVHLRHDSLLNLRPMGTFQITLIGPLGQDASFTIICLPECEFLGLEPLYIPDRKGAPSVQVEVRLGLIDHLQTIETGTNIKIQNMRPGIYSVSVPPDISRVDLQVLREYDNGEIIVPLDFRVRRLRWRLVTQDLLENWSDNLLDVAISSFAKLTSPLLIVSVPQGQTDSTDLYLRLLDTSSNELIQIRPARRSPKYSGDFWRFDLDALQSNLLETTAPILRLELIAGFTDNTKVELPVVSFTHAIDVREIKMDIQEGLDHYELSLSWREPTPLQNRCLYIWSLWRAWQSVQVISIPDDLKGIFEFRLSKEQLEGGEYRLGFAIVDPWVASVPPEKSPEKGDAGTTDFQVNLLNRITHLREKAHRFEEHLELGLISAYRGESIIAAQEIRWCAKNIRLATSRQILILREYLDENGQDVFKKQFGENIIVPGVLEILLGDARKGNITGADIASLLKLAPPSSDWTDAACELLFDFEDRRWRIEALRGLVTKKPHKAVRGALSLVKNGAVGIEDAVELLYENKPNVIELLKYDYAKNVTAQKILELLHIYNPYSGLPMVRPGTWIRTNAGWGKIESIQEAVSHTSVDEFMANQGTYRLIVRLHIELDADFQGERAIIDMKDQTISFLRTKVAYICEHCQEFISANREMYRTHIALGHPGKYPSPPTAKTTFPYTVLEFDHTRK